MIKVVLWAPTNGGAVAAEQQSGRTPCSTSPGKHRNRLVSGQASAPPVPRPGTPGRLSVTSVGPPVWSR